MLQGNSERESVSAGFALAPMGQDAVEHVVVATTAVGD